MKWPAVKNLILGLLIAMNIFTLTVTVIRQIDRERIPPLTRAAAAEAMKNNGIICGEELIPDKYMTVRGLKAKWFTASELSPMFFGEQLAFQTDGRALIAHSGDGVLLVEDNKFSYSSGQPAVKADEKQLRKALKGLGLDMSHAVYEGGGSFSCRYGELPIFDMYISAELTRDNMVARIEAKWPASVSKGRNENGISLIECIPDVVRAFPNGGRVEKIELGYELTEGDAASAALRPAWRVTMEDARSAVFVR